MSLATDTLQCSSSMDKKTYIVVEKYHDSRLFSHLSFENSVLIKETSVGIKTSEDRLWNVIRYEVDFTDEDVIFYKIIYPDAQISEVQKVSK